MLNFLIMNNSDNNTKDTIFQCNKTLNKLIENHTKTYNRFNVLIGCVVVLFLAVVALYFYVRFSNSDINNYLDRICIDNNANDIEALKDSIKAIDNRYTTLLAELAIWIAALVGVMTVLTIIIEYIFKHRAKEEYDEMFNKIELEKNKMLGKITKSEEYLQELHRWVNFYNACTGLQALHSSIRISTPMLKHLLSDMFYEAVEIKEQLLKIETKKCSLAYLTIYRTLDYIYPLLINEYVDLEIKHISSLRDNLYRLILLLEMYRDNYEIGQAEHCDIEQENDNCARRNNGNSEVANLVIVVINQIEMLASILKTEARRDVQKCKCDI